MKWRIAHGGELSLDRPLVMGVLNVTPDSFSDGGRFLDTKLAVERAREMVSEGADIIDIGGESTRPGAPEITLEEERARILPVIDRLREAIAVPLSIDTQKPAIAAEAVARGGSIVNDIAAGVNDPAMLELVANTGCGYVCMHMQGNPRIMQQAPVYDDVVGEVDRFFSNQLQGYERQGIAGEQVVLDVGIGFGKTPTHNLELLRHLESYKKHGRPILLGVSRKSFIGRTLGLESPSERVSASLACACWGAQAGAVVFRVHDVAETSQVLRMWRAIERLE